MLSKFLRAASLKKTIDYVGGYAAGFVGSTSNITVTLTSLTGGLASQPAAGDFVLVYFGVAANQDRNLVVSGYTELTELYIASGFQSNNTNLAVAYKFMTGTPDTSITLTGGTFDVTYGGAVYISVWRKVNRTTPFDVTQTTATINNSVRPDPPAITPVTPGSVIIAGGAGAHDRNASGTYGSSDLTAFRTAVGNDDKDATIGGGYKVWTGGAFNPARFTFGSTDNTAFSSAAVTLALRPA
jgi:hypothetical protein